MIQYPIPESASTYARRVARAGALALALVVGGWATAAAGLTIDWTRVTPGVIRVDNTSPVVISAKVSGGVPTSVQFAAADGTTLAMHDDGAGADGSPGDGVYSVQIPAALANGGLQSADVFRKFVGFVDLYQGTTRLLRVFVQTQVWTPAIGLVNVVSPDAQTQYSNHVLNLVDPATLAAGAGADFRPLARRFYEAFNDNVDFLDIVFDFGHVANRYHFGVRNAVVGIGTALFDHSDDYGSAGKLQGLTIFPSATYFDPGQEAHSHEIGHQWINFLPQPALAGGIPHWPLSSLASGIMGFSIPGEGAGGDYGCRLRPAAGGIQLSATASPRLFTDLDLYLMGLKAATEVGDHYVWNDQQAALTQACTGTFALSKFARVSINDVIATTGPRQPAFPNAQRDFKVGVIVVSAAKLPAEAMAYYDWFAQRADARAALPIHQGFSVGNGNPFYVATGGAGTMSARLRDGPAAGTQVTVAEFYAPSLNHYFRTANADEAAALKANPALGWQATGGDFKAYARNDHPSNAQPVCRFYGSLSPGPNSHFYTAEAAECAALQQLQGQTPSGQPRWNYEETAFAIAVPAGGTCPAGAPVPVYRAYNDRALQNDSNHRYTTSATTYQQMIAQGWKGEGVTMCAPN